MTLGSDLAEAIAAKDHGRVQSLLHDDVDFKAMTPRKYWECPLPEALAVWFDEGDVIEGVDEVTTDAFADRERVGYRLRVRNDEGLHLVEQQAFIGELDGKIGWLRIMCAGYRPIDG